MEILEGEALYRTLLQRYSVSPRGWSFTFSRSPDHGFYDALVGGPEGSWQLKLDTIFKPHPLVLGAQTDLDSTARTPESLSFGFRRVEPRAAQELLADSPEAMRRLLGYLGSIEPVAPSAPGSYVQGPFVFASRGLDDSTMTREQRSVDNRLSEEMLRLVRRRYPGYS